MKKSVLIIVFLTFTLTSSFIGTLRANPVDPTTAHKAAAMLLAYLDPSKASATLNDITAATPLTGMYVFAIGKEEGFIVVAADDNTDPIVAYSLENPFPKGDMPPHVRAWYRGYEQKIEANSYNEGKEAATARAKWRDLLIGNMHKSAKASIPRMIRTQWDQEPLYNELCPYDSAARRRPPAGCTAIATAQIMKYFEHPTTGYGSGAYHHWRFGDLTANYGETTYDWDNMPVLLNNNSSDAQINAVSTLVYHVGVAVHMAYKIGGSAGKTASYGYGGEPSSENAFKYNFRYSPYVWTAFRIDYTLEDWEALMLNELEYNRPILYAGYDEVQSGHAFVIDGYNANTDKFHFNWGWGGKYDGYCSLDNLNPSSTTQGPSSYHFDLFATATIGIEPYALWSEVSQTTVLTATQGINGALQSDGTVSGAGTYQFGDTIVLTATATNEHSRFVQWSDGCRYNPRVTVATGGEVSFTAQFAPVQGNLVRYHTCDNAMNRASNLPDGLGCDSVWGIKISAASLSAGSTLNAIRFMGRKAATHTLTILAGTNAPEEELYSSTFFDSLDYEYTFHTHLLPSPIAIDGSKSLWIKLKCTEIDTPAVFSIYGGNPNSMLVGDDLTSRGEEWKFSWMIEALFDGNSTAGITVAGSESGHMHLSPNPTNSTVTINEIKPGSAIEIFDMSGRLCRSLTATSERVVVSVADLMPGMYIVRSCNNEGMGTAKLIVK